MRNLVGLCLLLYIYIYRKRRGRLTANPHETYKALKELKLSISPDNSFYNFPTIKVGHKFAVLLTKASYNLKIRYERSPSGVVDKRYAL